MMNSSRGSQYIKPAKYMKQAGRDGPSDDAEAVSWGSSSLAARSLAGLWSRQSLPRALHRPCL
jgi:hypothetical protein